MNFKKRVNGSWTDTPHYIHNTSTDTIATLPAVIYSTGTTATVGLKGQTVQSTTPTPDNPVMPQGTGERTGNLFDKSKRTNNSRVVYTTGEIGALFGTFVSDFTPIEPNTTYTLNIVSNISGKTGHLFALYDENKNFVNTGAHEATTATVYTFTTPSNVAYIRFNGNMASVDEIMLNLGSTPLPYEPHGIKIPISSADTTTNIYLGEVQTTRQIKKLVLTGQENITKESGNAVWKIPAPGLKLPGTQSIYWLCSHYESVSNSASWTTYDYCISWSGTDTYALRIRDKNYPWSATLESFKQYLAAQYAAGTPVCVWYVLATEETAVVNEPLMRIGDYADTVSNISIPVTAGGDTLSVGTTVQPSEVTVNYKGWHPVADVHERDNGAWT